MEIEEEINDKPFIIEDNDPKHCNHCKFSK